MDFTVHAVTAVLHCLMHASNQSIFRDGGMSINLKGSKVQVYRFQKPSFLHQLTLNMTRDCSLNSTKNTSSQKLFLFVCFDIQNNICTQHVVVLYFSGNSMNNLSSY